MRIQTAVVEVFQPDGQLGRSGSSGAPLWLVQVVFQAWLCKFGVSQAAKEEWHMKRGMERKK